MNIYHYDPDTRYFIREGFADAIPAELAAGLDEAERWIIPAHATRLAPPEVPQGWIARHFPAAHGWEEGWDIVELPVEQENEAPRALTLGEEKEAALREIERLDSALYENEVFTTARAAEYLVGYHGAAAWLQDTSKPAPGRVLALAETKNLSATEAAALVVSKWEEASKRIDRRGAERIRAAAAVRAATTPADVADALAAGMKSMEGMAAPTD
jgi:hypothetical protein